MKKTQVKALVLTLCVLFLNACSNLFQNNHQQETLSPDAPEGFGTVRVSFSRGAARTVMPDVELANLYLEYWFAKDGEAAVEKVPNGDEFILESGSYTLTVKALAENDNPETLVAQGSTAEPFVIAAGGDAGTVDIALSPVVTGEGTGSLEFGLRYPEGVTVESLTLTRIAAEEPPLDLLDPEPGIEGTDPLTLSGVKDNIPVGYYILAAQLKNAEGLVTGKTEVVHIYQNLAAKTALAGYTFTDEDFNAVLVTNDSDSGVGSLRQAIIDAPSGKTIRVTLEPGKPIELTSVIQISVSKTLLIEGNGAILTRGSSAAISSSSQLLYISGSSVNLTIRGIHFKGARTTTYGGAIRNSGTLTLESCIFSDNQTTAITSYGMGGAIYSTASGSRQLTIRGCTFYGNSAGYAGGAVYSSGPLTLTGNLFRGNTGGTNGYPVVYKTGTFNASYNLVDIAFGATTTGSGWEEGTGDRYSAAPSISGKTFKVLSGSAAAGALAALPDNYPVADFYGNPIGTGAATGAVQELAAGSGYYLELSVNDSQRGSLKVDPLPDDEGFVSGDITITPTANTGYFWAYYLVNGTRVDTPPTALTAHSKVQAVFGLAVTDFTDTAGTAATTPGTLRYALTNAQAGDPIFFNGVTPGATEIPLTSRLPTINKSVTIEGNGVTLTPADSWTVSGSSQLLYITGGEVTIRGIHFKGGRAANNSGAIHKSGGTLTLEACIFTDNRTTAMTGMSAAGGIASSGSLTIRACTFYGNAAYYRGGAIYSTGTLTLTGNLFYGSVNSTYGCPVVSNEGGTIVASYNLVDSDFGTANLNCGWEQGTGDVYSNDPFIMSPKTFRLLSGSASAGMLTLLPENYPTKDFYGNPIVNGAAAGAVQAFAAGNGYYLDLSAGNSLAGIVEVSPLPNEDGIVPAAITLTPTANSGYSFAYYLVNGEREHTLTSLTGHSQVRAIFNTLVNNFADTAGSETTPGTLRYALTNAQDNDIILFSGVTPGTTEIALTKNLPAITKNLTIEGNGVTLTRDASWPIAYNANLLTFNRGVTTIRGVHFKGGRTWGPGAAILANSPSLTLTLESCIFSDNLNTASSSNYNGGAISNAGSMTIRACTFYGNGAGIYGGAVASSGTLTLVGNVFYGNSGGAGYPVVYNTGTIAAASYNLTDTGFGTTYLDSGWAQGTGDRHSSAIPVSGKTFKLLSESAAAGALTSLPADYPSTDFYGNSIAAGDAAGAVQATVAGGGYYLGLSTNNSLSGTVSVSPQPDTDGMVPAGAITLTPDPVAGYVLAYYLVNGARENSLTSLTVHSLVQAVFGREVNNFTDADGSETTPGALRYALTNAQNNDIIVFTGVTPGVTEIPLTASLPLISRKNLAIEGNGVTLTRDASNVSLTRMLQIDNASSVTIRRVHFKGGRALAGAAIRNNGNMILESCIFSDNRWSSPNFAVQADSCGAIYNSAALTLRGCTFYGNNAGKYGGAVYSTGKLFLIGNLFAANSASEGYPVVYNSGTLEAASYNVTDTIFGTASSDSGWEQGTGDRHSNNLLISGKTFKLLSGSAAANVHTSLPAGYPSTDFYGNPIAAGAAAGAVQTAVAGGGYYLELFANNSLEGTVAASPQPDSDGMVPAGAVTLTPDPALGYALVYYLVNGERENTLTTLTGHTRVEAVFGLEVNNFTDTAGTAATTPGTLRYALTNIRPNDLIVFKGVIPGTTQIELTRDLPVITRNVTIEGNGITLTRAASSNASQLLRIDGYNPSASIPRPLVTIRRVHFKGGSSQTGAGIYANYAAGLIVESCIFNDNQGAGTNSRGSAIYFDFGSLLVVRGCTFYNNNASGDSGTIYGIITSLTGSLFYGNTAGQDRVVNNTVQYSAGNVVDFDFALGSNNRWIAGDGDKTTLDDGDGLTITGAPFDTTTFRPVSGLLNVLTTKPEDDFPLTDFYGATRTFPGAPGAVSTQ
ncbi:MAG: right-handed parallel beta-helix repeat-containing protein [Treponema sp.]|jgi:predicted outer membrane repeat protein|nr:right-handed parallel beta-helix repeat-containing protein [Treponema sp.]